MIAIRIDVEEDIKETFIFEKIMLKVVLVHSKEFDLHFDILWGEDHEAGVSSETTVKALVLVFPLSPPLYF